MNLTEEIGVATIAFVLVFVVSAAAALALTLWGFESPAAAHTGNRPWWMWWMWWMW